MAATRRPVPDISGGSGKLSELLRRGAELLPEKLEAAISRASVENDPAWPRLMREVYRHSCALFAADVLTGPPQAPYNGRFLLGPHHVEWDAMLQTHDRLCVLAARDHGKTFFYNFAYPIWKAVTQPGSTGFIFSATQDQAERILLDIKTEIETNPRLRWLYPEKDKAKRWGARFIRLSNGTKAFARGYHSRVRGAHPEWIVVDDGLNDETAYSDTVRKKQIEYYYNAVTPMSPPGGQLICVGTPFHELDLYGDLSRNKEYVFRRFPALDEKTNKPLWSARYSLKLLLRRKREIGSVRFAREMLCVPVSDDMSLFPSYLFRGAPIEQAMATLGQPLEYWKSLGVRQVFMGVDFALSSSASADYFVIWTVGVDENGNRWLMDVQRELGMPYHQQKALMNKIGRMYDPDLMMLEANQSQRIYGDELIRETDLPIKKYDTGAEKHLLERGIPSMRILLENKKYRLPRGDRHSIEVTDLWVNEMRGWTFEDGKVINVGAHDDVAMASWLCEQGIRLGAFGFSMGDVEGAEDLKTLMDELTRDGDGGNGESPEKGNGEDTRASLVDEEFSFPVLPGLRGIR